MSAQSAATRWRDTANHTPARSGPTRSASTRTSTPTVGDLSFADFYALKSKIVRQGKTPALLDLHANTTTAAVEAGGSIYGSFVRNPVDGALEAPETNALRVRFEEANG